MPVRKKTSKKATRKAATARPRAAKKVTGKVRPVAATKAAEPSALLARLSDAKAPVESRFDALAALQAASFQVTEFQSIRAQYIAVLRGLVGTPELELRQRVLGILSREHDRFAQKKLLDGLDNEAKALVSPEKALQLLSYDAHAETYEAARKILAEPPNELARREALRLLSADGTSTTLFADILQDREAPEDLRRLSAAALRTHAPDRLNQYAREIILDSAESETMHETSLSALTQFGESDNVSQDEKLRARVQTLGKGARPVAQSARRFLEKYSR